MANLYVLEIGIDKDLERMYKKEREGGIDREKSNKGRERENLFANDLENMCKERESEKNIEEGKEN